MRKIDFAHFLGFSTLKGCCTCAGHLKCSG